MSNKPEPIPAGKRTTPMTIPTEARPSEFASQILGRLPSDLDPLPIEVLKQIKVAGNKRDLSYRR
ncbi:hypothetical protein I8G32_03723 [Rhodopseudomonas palustris]|nr:hypothetical protein I8G32_03723 [Rhodopseudomonas palustris]